MIKSLVRRLFPAKESKAKKAEREEAELLSRLADHNRKVWASEVPQNPEGEILVDYSATADRIIAWSYYSNRVANYLNCRLVAFTSRWKQAEDRVGYAEIFASFNCHDFVSSIPDEPIVEKAREATESCRKEFRNKQDVLAYRYKGLELGEDFYDSYLRYVGEVTVNLDDPVFWETVQKGFEIYFFWERYFDEHPVKALFVTQPFYIRHGPISRLAWSRGIPIFNGSLGGFWCDRSINGLAEKFREFPVKFRELKPEYQKMGLEYARKRLHKRLSGRSDMHYMANSAFARGDEVDLPDSDRDVFKVVVCTHDFFDNPRAQQGMIFEDFYEWLKFLGEYSEKRDYLWYLKVHPNANDVAYGVLNELCERYKSFRIVPKGVSHHQLVESGVKVCLTCYGTVAFEYPLMGVPVVNASSNNPNIAYDFCYHAPTRERYTELLDSIEELKVPEDLTALYENFFMQNFPDREAGFFIKDFQELRRQIGIKAVGGSEMFRRFLDQWTEERHRNACEWVNGELEEMLKSGSRSSTLRRNVDEEVLRRVLEEEE